jgi:hypothetical protein
MESGTQERLARTEALFRQVNERINDVGDGLRDDETDLFICECGDPTCTERIPLSGEEYDCVRASPTRFVLAPGHAAPEVEHVVERDKDHVVIEKVGIAGRVAAALDPRAA